MLDAVDKGIAKLGFIFPVFCLDDGRQAGAIMCFRRPEDPCTREFLRFPALHPAVNQLLMYPAGVRLDAVHFLWFVQVG